MFLHGCKAGVHKKYLNAMITYANVFYFRGVYYKVFNVDAFWDYYAIYDVQPLVELYTYMLIEAAKKIPLEIRRQLIDNVQAAIRLY